MDSATSLRFAPSDSVKERRYYALLTLRSSCHHALRTPLPHCHSARSRVSDVVAESIVPLEQSSKNGLDLLDYFIIKKLNFK